MKKVSLSKQVTNGTTLKDNNKLLSVNNKLQGKVIYGICPKKCSGGVCFSTWKPSHRPAA